MNVTIPELKALCAELNLNVIQLGKKEAKIDYETALRNYYLQQDYPSGNLPEHLSLILQMRNPMLCYNYKHMKPSEQEAIWDSEEWFLERKFDGLRALNCFIKGEFEVYGRNDSTVNFRKIPYASKIPKENIDFTQIKDDFIFDSEVICTTKQMINVFRDRGMLSDSNLQACETLFALNDEESQNLQRHYNYPLRFYAFTLIYYNGEWLFDKTEKERKSLLETVYPQLMAANFPVSLSEVIQGGRDVKKKFYDSIIYEGGEGSVAKLWTGKYTPTSSRLRTGWIKIKGEIGERMQVAGLGDTIDGFVSGFEPADDDSIWAGLIGSLKVSVNVIKSDGTEEERHIATVSNIDYDFRKEITVKDEDGKVSLSPLMYGKVYEISGQSFSPVNQRLKHAIIVRERFDKNANECLLSEEILNKFIY